MIHKIEFNGGRHPPSPQASTYTCKKHTSPTHDRKVLKAIYTTCKEYTQILTLFSAFLHMAVSFIIKYKTNFHIQERFRSRSFSGHLSHSVVGSPGDEEEGEHVGD